MRMLIQRVSEASVSVKNEIIGRIGKGLMILVGITHGDGEKETDYLIEKITNLRIFENEQGKLDLSALDTKAELLIVSQFTLYGECDKGRRPDFGKAAPLEEAKETYGKVLERFQKTGLKIEHGQFQAHMKVNLINDGPLTLMLESKKQ